MRAQVITETGNISPDYIPLRMKECEEPQPAPGEIKISVEACGVCHTELDEIEGRAEPPQLPVIPGHQVIGIVESTGDEVENFSSGDRAGAGWIFSSCGECRFCRKGLENLCRDFKATGRDAHGGYAEYMVISSDYAVGIPEGLSPVSTAPLLCAGSIGYRSLKLAEISSGEVLGLTGFGASGHLVLQLARGLFDGLQIYVFARREETRDFARKLGADWAGDTRDRAPQLCHAIIDTTPAWLPVKEALANLERGGRLVINAIRKGAGDREELLNLEYSKHLWLEKEIKSVANVTKSDLEGIISAANRLDISPEITTYSLREAHKALLDIKMSRGKGARVLKIGGGTGIK